MATLNVFWLMVDSPFNNVSLPWSTGEASWIVESIVTAARLGPPAILRWRHVFFYDVLFLGEFTTVAKIWVFLSARPAARTFLP